MGIKKNTPLWGVRPMVAHSFQIIFEKGENPFDAEDAAYSDLKVNISPMNSELSFIQENSRQTWANEVDPK
jgi:hypothetical protein